MLRLTSYLIFALLPFTHASSNSTNIGAWLRNTFLPEQGPTIQDELKCYALPYGGIGFLSHVLTYWTCGMLIAGLSPLFPRPGERIKHSLPEVLLALATIIFTLPITIMTMYACRRRWEFVLIAIWKLLLSITLSAITIHLGAVTSKKKNHDWTKVAPWTSIYGLGTFVGMVGLLHLVKTEWSSSLILHKLTFGFLAVGGFPVPIVFIWSFASWFLYALRMEDKFEDYYCCCFDDVSWQLEGRQAAKYLSYTVLYFGLWCAFYCDWVLAALDGHYSGIPSTDIALLYWAYFAAKRLPMLSF